jgi:polyisoprenoid-binding protein YceI
VIRSKSFVALVVILVASYAAAAQRPASGTWAIVPSQAGDLGLTFSLGWTLGTHQGKASRVTGSLEAQPDPLVITGGEFHVPITAMSTGSTTRDCHMREALGIDYKNSHFPANHVCMNDEVPPSGPDSVVYPEIVIRIRGPQPASARAAAALDPKQPVDVMVPLEFSVHGVTRTVSAPLRLQWTKPDLVHAQTEFDLKLADFGIVVIMPRLMSVDDHVHVKLNLQLAQQPPRR